MIGCTRSEDPLYAKENGLIKTAHKTTTLHPSAVRGFRLKLAGDEVVAAGLTQETFVRAQRAATFITLNKETPT